MVKVDIFLYIFMLVSINCAFNVLICLKFVLMYRNILQNIYFALRWFYFKINIYLISWHQYTLYILKALVNYAFALSGVCFLFILSQLKLFQIYNSQNEFNGRFSWYRSDFHSWRSLFYPNILCICFHDTGLTVIEDEFTPFP